MTRRAAKIDANHVELTEALRKMGYIVRSTAAVGQGFPDAIAYKRGVVYLLEFKSRRGTLTPDQVDFAKEGWPVYIVKTFEDIIALESVKPEDDQ